MLDPSKSKVDGLAFLGLSLSRHSDHGHPDSITHQTAFDLNEVIDRDYEHIFSTNDDGWLVGGGEPVSIACLLRSCIASRDSDNETIELLPSNDLTRYSHDFNSLGIAQHKGPSQVV